MKMFYCNNYRQLSVYICFIENLSNSQLKRVTELSIFAFVSVSIYNIFPGFFSGHLYMIAFEHSNDFCHLKLQAVLKKLKKISLR